MEHYEFEVELSMSDEQEARFREDHGLPAGTELGPHVAAAVRERMQERFAGVASVDARFSYEE